MEDYTETVAISLTELLLGVLDREAPRIEVRNVTRETERRNEVLAIRVEYECHEVLYTERFSFDEWEDFSDMSPQTMADWLATFVRMEIREAINSRPH